MNQKDFGNTFLSRIKYKNQKKFGQLKNLKYKQFGLTIQ